MINYTDVLTDLTSSFAVSGSETDITGKLSQYFGKYCDSVTVDRNYNVIGLKKGSGKSHRKLMITAHADEIGLIVSGIDEGGFLRVSPVGGADARVLLAQEVIIHGKTRLTGVIGAKPPHLLSEEDRRKSVKIKDLSVDTGLSREEIRKYVSIGDIVTLKSNLLPLQGGRLCSRAIDNRSGVAAVIGAMERLTRLNHRYDVYFAATVQEELELTGAVTAAYGIAPDLAVVVDACHGEVPDAPRDETFALGKGPAVALGPVLHRGFTRLLLETASRIGVSCQRDVESRDTGTEAWATQVSRNGVPTVLVSIPVKYMHTPVEVVQISDIEAAGRLIAEYAASGDEMEGLFCC